MTKTTEHKIFFLDNHKKKIVIFKIIIITISISENEVFVSISEIKTK